MQCKRRRLRQCLFTRRYQLHQATSQLHVAWETHTTTLTENPSFLNCLSTFSRCLYKFPSYLHGSQSTAIKYHPLASSFSIHHQKGLEAVGTGRYTTDPVMHVSVMPDAQLPSQTERSTVISAIYQIILFGEKGACMWNVNDFPTAGVQRHSKTLRSPDSAVRLWYYRYIAKGELSKTPSVSQSSV